MQSDPIFLKICMTLFYSLMSMRLSTKFEKNRRSKSFWPYTTTYKPVGDAVMGSDALSLMLRVARSSTPITSTLTSFLFPSWIIGRWYIWKFHSFYQNQRYKNNNIPFKRCNILLVKRVKQYSITFTLSSCSHPGYWDRAICIVKSYTCDSDFTDL